MAYYDNAPSHKPQGKKSFGREKWELIGDQPGSGSELMLIGMMVSSAQIELAETSVRLELEIRLA